MPAQRMEREKYSGQGERTVEGVDPGRYSPTDVSLLHVALQPDVPAFVPATADAQMILRYAEVAQKIREYCIRSWSCTVAKGAVANACCRSYSRLQPRFPQSIHS